MAAGAKRAVNNPIEEILGLVNTGKSLFLGNKSTTTTKNNVSQEGIQQLINNTLSSTQGLGNLAQGARTAGLYNSSTTQLLINDLISKATAEAEARRGGTTQTTITPPAIDPLGGAAALLATQVLGPTVKQAGAGLGTKVKDLILGNAVKNPEDLGAGIDSSAVTDMLFGSTSAQAPMFNIPGLSSVTSAANSFSSGVDSAANTATNFISGLFGAGASGISSSLLDAANASADPIGSLFDAGAFGDATAGSVPIIGPTIQLAQGDVKGAAGSAIGGYLGSISPLGPGVGTAVGSFIGNIVGGSLGCFITTAVTEASGKPDNCYELQTLREFRDTYMQSNPELKQKLIQYYVEAPAIADKLDKLPKEYRQAAYAELEGMVLKSVTQIKEGKNEEAVHTYQRVFELAKDLTSGV